MRPDTFIVGAAKCGTTSLFSQLSAHPQVFGCPLKEPNYFGRDLPLGDMSEQEYLALFRGARHHKRLVEASAWYLFSPAAPSEIHAFNPDARIVIAVRNPLDMMFSLHGMRLFTGEEDVEDFGEALAADEQRGMGGRFTGSRRPFPPGAGYRAAARLSPQIERYLGQFGASKVHFVLFDDLVSDAARVHAELLRFLDLEEIGTPHPKPQKQRSRSRSPVIRDLLRDPPGRALIRMVLPRRLRRALWGDSVWKLLYRANAAPVRGARMDTALRHSLQSEFASEFRRLGELLDRDLVRLWDQQEPVKGASSSGGS